MMTTLFCADEPWQGLEDLFLFVRIVLSCFGDMNDEKMLINGMTTTLFCADKSWQGLEDLFLFVFVVLCCFWSYE